jgi:hypothetical protein
MTWDTDIYSVYRSITAISGTSSVHYLISFLDDRSPYIVHAELLPDKSMTQTAQALRNALAIAPHPLRVTLDNGKEFVSKEFITVEKAQGINHHPFPS